MAKALQHDQAALIARISAACATDNEPVPDTARSGRANAIVSQPRWYKISVRSAEMIKDLLNNPIVLILALAAVVIAYVLYQYLF
jgi:hypothetical protein